MQRTWEELIAEIRVRKTSDEVSIHKPLLLLMVFAAAQKGGQNEFHFKDLADPLAKALRDCGADTKRFHPEYPFWRLVNDDIWMIDNKDELAAVHSTGEPTEKTLRDHDATARVPPHLWQQLLDEPALTKKLIKWLLAQYWPEPGAQAEVIEHTGVSVEP